MGAACVVGCCGVPLLIGTGGAALAACLGWLVGGLVAAALAAALVLGFTRARTGPRSEPTEAVRVSLGRRGET